MKFRLSDIMVSSLFIIGRLSPDVEGQEIKARNQEERETASGLALGTR
jgi:hypothetical protein